MSKTLTKWDVAEAVTGNKNDAPWVYDPRIWTDWNGFKYFDPWPEDEARQYIDFLIPKWEKQKEQRRENARRRQERRDKASGKIPKWERPDPKKAMIENMKREGFVFAGDIPIECPKFSGRLIPDNGLGEKVKKLTISGYWYAFDADNRLYIKWPMNIRADVMIALAYIFIEGNRVILNSHGEPDDYTRQAWTANVKYRVSALRDIPQKELSKVIKWYGNGEEIYEATVGELRTMMTDENVIEDAREVWREKVRTGRTVQNMKLIRERRASLSAPKEVVEVVDTLTPEPLTNADFNETQISMAPFETEELAEAEEEEPRRREFDLAGVVFVKNGRHYVPVGWNDKHIDKLDIWKRPNGTGKVRVFSTTDDLEGYVVDFGDIEPTLRKGRAGFFFSNLSYTETKIVLGV